MISFKINNRYLLHVPSMNSDLIHFKMYNLGTCLNLLPIDN